MTIQEYKDHEFCKSVDCLDLISKVYNGGFIEECSVYQSSCGYTAKDFHKWLNANGYKIVKETEDNADNK